MEQGAVLEPDEVLGAEDEEQELPQEVPSVFSVVTRYLVGGAEVTEPAEDGSRVLRLHAASGQAIVEANLSAELCQFLSGKLVAVKVLAEDDPETDEDAGAAE